MFKKSVIAALFFVSLSATTIQLQAQNSHVTEAGMSFQDNDYEATIASCRKALDKPELLNEKNKAKAHALLAQSLITLYAKVDKAPADTAKNPESKKNWLAKKETFKTKYPNALDDAKKSMDYVKTSPEGGSWNEKLDSYRQNLALMYIQKVANYPYNQQVKMLGDAEALLLSASKPSQVFLLFLHNVRGTVHLQQGSSTKDDNIERASMADYKKAVEIYKKLPPMSAQEAELKKQIDETMAGAYANLITVSTSHDKGNLKTLCDEAKAKFSTMKDLDPKAMKPLEDAILQAQISTGSGDDGEKALADAIQADPKNMDKRLLYASQLEKKYNSYVESKKPEAEIEGAYNKVVQAYKDALQINPEVEAANFNLGAIYFNRSVEVSKQINALPDDAPDSKYNALVKKQKEYMNLALPYFEKAAAKNNYKDESSLSTLITIAITLEMKDKQAFYEGKRNALKK